MNQTNNKLWASKEIFDALGYKNLTNQADKKSHHEKFKFWINKNFDKKIDVIDIGRGNGRVINHIKDEISSYLNLDLNTHNIEVGSEFFKDLKNCKFMLCDIDKDDISSIDKVDVFYIDSVLTMLEKPLKVLSKIKDKCDYIFLNRTPLYNETNLEFYNWQIPNQPNSHLWKFSWESLHDFCKENGMELHRNYDKNDYDEFVESLYIKTNID